MIDQRISRRSALVAASAMMAWAASPARALLVAADRDDDAKVRARIEPLLAQMTIEEKAGQLTLMAAAWGGSSATALNPPTAGGSFDKQLDAVRRGQLTGVFNGNGAEMALRMQKAAMQSRLKIPLIFGGDVIHGLRTVFPVPLGEAASFEPDLAERTARAAASEATATGIDWSFAPMVDIARDARWGRMVEGAGEDVYLGSQFAAARVRGFQGKALNDPVSVLACPKHFAAYGAVEGGLDYNTVDVSKRTLRDVYFPPFEAALDAGALSIMAAFTALQGIPATGNHWLLTDVLRDEWHFPGLCVSDYTADAEMVAHGYAKDDRDAARLAIMAGVDMSMQSGLYLQYLPDLVVKGEVPIARVDEAVRRVLWIKAKLGLFDDPFLRIDPKRAKARILTPANRALAREAARRSVVLLKNDGDVLPLKPAGQRIALIGPFAEGKHDLIGPWNVYGSDDDAVDIATGIRGAMKDPSLLTVVQGSDVDQPLPGGIDAAVAAASAADVVLLAIGESQAMSGEAQSRVAIVVPEAQQALAEAVAKTGKPVVVLLKNGRALALDGAVRDAAAIMVTWFLGTETGTGLADALFGKAGPSGRLPVSFPHATGQEPYYYAHLDTGRPNPPGPMQPYKAHYRTVRNEALYPFGHGLTYGRVGYAGLEGDGATLAWDGSITLGATITNSGSHAAEEVVQLYVRDRTASVAQPIRELKGFRKIALAPGASQAVRFTLSRKDLLFVGQDMAWTVERGAFDFWIAPSAAEGLQGSFTLTKA
ncbi:MAG: glycoside hydrolase family 3 N-terminal domain-containing protein [Sphingomonas sp.]